MSAIDTGIIFAYMALMLVIGLYASHKQDNVEDYFVASGRLGTVSIACLWLSSYVGGAAIIAGAANAYDMGISAGWYIGAMIIGCAGFGMLFAARVKRLGNHLHGLGSDLDIVYWRRLDWLAYRDL
jgi:SSS family solute:Na+ symporter